MRLSVPSSILLGSVVIALGLFLGLRQRAPVSPAPGPAPAAGTSAPTTMSPPSTTVGSPVPAPRPPSAEETLAAVTAEVEQAKPRWKAACWDTADPVTRTPGRYTAGLAFDAAGRLTISGVGEVRGNSDPSVAQCMRLQVNDFEIPAPGRSLVFDIPFEMP